MYAWSNPPQSFWRDCPLSDWLVWQLLLPLLEIYEASVRSLGDDTYRVRLVVHNTGWLPTTSPKSLEKAGAGCICEIELPVGATLGRASRVKNWGN